MSSWSDAADAYMLAGASGERSVNTESRARMTIPVPAAPRHIDHLVANRAPVGLSPSTSSCRRKSYGTIQQER
jgi:hypothetical protein